MRRPLCRIALAVSLLAPPGAAQCADWSDGFHAQGVDGSVNALEVWNDGGGPVLYVGGSFQFAGGLYAEGIVRWDGAQWSNVGGGLARTSGDAYVHDFLEHDDGSGPQLYVAGRFSTAGGVVSESIARWSGSAWTDVGGGVTLGDAVYALELFDDGSGGGPQLYAGGTFGSAGGTSSVGVARWDGLLWHPVGNWSQAKIRSVAAFGSELYVGGTFSTGTGASFDALARWDGTAWSDVGGGLDKHVLDLEVFDNNIAGPRLFVGGDFNHLGNNGLAIWSGSSWDMPGCNLNAEVHELAVLVEPGKTNQTLLVGGDFEINGQNHIVRWKKLGCIAFGTGTDGRVSAIEVFDDGSGPKLYAGGAFSTAGGMRADNIATWDGAAWSHLSLGGGAQNVVQALGVANVGSGPELYGAVGFSPVGPGRSIDRYDGTSWTRVAETDGQFNVIGGFDYGQGERLVVGGTVKDVDGTPVKNIAAYDGTSWSDLAGGIMGEVEDLHLFDFGAGPELVAAGQFVNPGNRIAVWNGTAWSTLADGFDKRVNALATFDEGSGPRLFAGGHMTRKLPLSGMNILLNRLARWSGTEWQKVHLDDTNGPIHAMVTYDPLDGSGPALVFGGVFSVPGPSIAGWNAVAWQQLVGGVNYKVNAMALYDDGSGPALYVGGNFHTAGSIAANNIARWDGTSWSTLGSGVDGEVYTFVVHDDGSGLGPALYVGGQFQIAGDKSSRYVARWGPASPCAPVPYCTSGVSSNGCAALLDATGVASASGAGPFDLSVTSADGNRSGLVFYGLSGPKSQPWGGGSYLCVRAPAQRTGVQFTGGTSGLCNGSFTLDWNAYVAAKPNALGNPFSAGRSVWVQAMVRDPATFKGVYLTRALRFVVYP
jgi:hypothetical protein